MTVRRVLLATALTAGAFAATTLTAGPASASCGTVHVPGQDTFEVCNPLIEKVEDLLKPT
jgi:hypothetical protein